SSRTAGTASGSKRADTMRSTSTSGTACNPTRCACAAVSSGEDCDRMRIGAPAAAAASSTGRTWSQTSQSCLTRTSSSGAIALWNLLRRRCPAPGGDQSGSAEHEVVALEQGERLLHVGLGEATLLHERPAQRLEREAEEVDARRVDAEESDPTLGADLLEA